MVCGNGIAEIEERDIKKSTHILILIISFNIFLTETVWFVMFFYSKSILRKTVFSLKKRKKSSNIVTRR